MKFTATALLAQGALAAAATSGDFTILTMNVAGLPEVLNPNGVPGGKEASSKTIGSKFAQYGYDVIHVQEVSSVFLVSGFSGRGVAWM